MTITFASTALAESDAELGVRTGFSTLGPDEDFELYDLIASYRLPWQWDTASGWRLSTRLHGSAGILDAAGKTGFVAALGPGIVLTHPHNPWQLDLGGDIAFLSREEFGEHDFGGPIQFTAHAGVALKVFRNLKLGYRFYHISDAQLYNGDTLNLNTIELSVLF